MVIHPYAKLARSAIEYYLKTKAVLPVPHYVGPDLQSQRACYIYILQKTGQQLRGSFGSPLPRRQNLAQEIIINTLAAAKTCATPLRRTDLSSTIYRVAVVDPMQRISDPAHLNPTIFGLYIKSDRGKSALVLPHRTGINTPEDQIATALREAAINQRQESVTMYRFHVNEYA